MKLLTRNITLIQKNSHIANVANFTFLLDSNHTLENLKYSLCNDKLQLLPTIHTQCILNYVHYIIDLVIFSFSLYPY